MKKIIVTAIFTLLSISTAKAALQLTISGPNQLEINQTATYTISYSGEQLLSADFDLIVDGNGVISNINPPPGWCPGEICINFNLAPIEEGFNVSIFNDLGPLDPNLCTFDLTATGTAGQVIHVVTYENGFLDLNWEMVSPASMPVLDVVITSDCTVPCGPDVLLADFNEAIINAGFIIGNIMYEVNSVIPAGRVIRTFPPCGAVVPCGTPIDIVVSTDCLYVGRVFSGPGITTLTVTQAMVDRWIGCGKPNCWCCDAQKRCNCVYSPTSTATKVDALDLAKIKNTTCWGRSYPDPIYCSTCVCCDTNLSGKVDAVDLAKCKNSANWGKTVGPGSGCN